MGDYGSNNNITIKARLWYVCFDSKIEMNQHRQNTRLDAIVSLPFIAALDLSYSSVIFYGRCYTDSEISDACDRNMKYEI